MLPPRRPMNASCENCFFERRFMELNSLIRIIIESRNAATITFFRKVKINGFVPFTAKLLAKMLAPLITAVRRIRKIPFVSGMVSIKGLKG